MKNKQLIVLLKNSVSIVYSAPARIYFASGNKKNHLELGMKIINIINIKYDSEKKNPQIYRKMHNIANFLVFTFAVYSEDKPNL